jgi:DNA-binding NarL/FixJ family response regulator
MVPRAILVESHDILRAGLRSILESHLHLDVIAEAADGRAAVRLSRELQPDMAFVDVGLPELNGVEVTRQIVSSCPEVRVIVLGEPTDRNPMLESLQAGARGYILKNATAAELGVAVQAVLQGGMYISPSLAHLMVDGYVKGIAPVSTGAFAVLTPREREVLQLIAEGKTAKEIGQLLTLSARTVEAHRAQIGEKLSLRSVAQLTKYAIREGLTTLDP